jgi:hypothetical protein
MTELVPVLSLCASVRNIRDNLHLAVRVRGKTAARRNAVFIDDSEFTEAHVLWIIVVAEGARMTAVKPTEFRRSALIARAFSYHCVLLVWFSPLGLQFAEVFAVKDFLVNLIGPL